MALDNPEFNEDLTPAEVADLCRPYLDPEVCDQIAGQETTEYALSLASAALADAELDYETILDRFLGDLQ